MRLITLAVCCIMVIQTSAQTLQKNECGTPSPAYPQFIDYNKVAQLRPMITTPYLMKVFVHIVADDNGTSNIAAPVEDVMRQMINMRNFYAAHNICFILAGIEQINNTDLNSMNTDTEAAELTPFLAANCLNIFVHNALSDNDGALNGNAYNIPNPFVSMVGTAITSTTNLSTLAHEMGHGFGLYHTFETFGDTRLENVPRSGDCTNCSANGDLLCDTEADRDEGVNASCVYSGTLRDACNNLFAPNTRNIMTYGNRACRNFFTTGQGQRAFDMITATPALSNTIAPDIASTVTNQNYTSGRQFLVARNLISVAAASFVVSNTARMNITAPKVVIKSGTRFTPTGTGYTKIRINTLCQ